jgi:flavin reductase (DIM6/NTAB) family NADH-FMN oxidoreductase RutF
MNKQTPLLREKRTALVAWDQQNNIDATSTSLANAFRVSLRGVGSSVMIVSTQFEGRRYGMVATSVMSVSLAPPSLALAINQDASIHGPVGKRGLFAINILSSQNEDVARGFVGVSGEDRFRFGDWRSRQIPDAGENGLPYLMDAQAVIFCKVRDNHFAGTHSLFIGEVFDVFGSDELSPLLYCGGCYGSFQTEPGTVNY